MGATKVAPAAPTPLATGPATCDAQATPVGGGVTTRDLRSDLYGIARLLGDVSAARRGPAALGRRVVRRGAYRATNAALWRALKRAGLG